MTGFGRKEAQHSRFAHFLDQFQTLPYNSLIFGTLVQPDGNAAAHGLVHGAEEPKSRWTVNFQKLCDFKSLPIVENRRKNERTVSVCLRTHVFRRTAERRNIMGQMHASATETGAKLA